MNRQKIEGSEYPKYRIIEISERLRIDPRGLGRLTLLGDNRFIIDEETWLALSTNPSQNQIQSNLRTEEK
jgi:hypothetical protein